MTTADQTHGGSFTEAVAGIWASRPDVFSPSALPFSLAGLQNWVTCFCALDFNVEIGPEFECIYPAVEFSEADLKTVCFSSFPEQSYAGDSTEAFHSFRFKSTSNNITFPPTSALAQLPGGGGGNGASGGERCLYGYVLFRQNKDTSKVRHYSQKSLCLISPYEFPALFETCVRKIAKYSFATDALIPVLQTAAGHIAHWPDPLTIATRAVVAPSPQRGSSSTNSPQRTRRMRKYIDLAYLGDKIRVHLAADSSIPFADYSGKADDTDVYLYGSIGGSGGGWGWLARAFEEVTELYTIYELVMLGRTLAILSNTPALCSRIVTNAVDLIKPIPYTGLVREYVTMHADLDALNVVSRHPVPGIVGFTNPFVAQMAEDCDGAVCVVDVTARRNNNSYGSSWGAGNGRPSLNVNFLPVLPDMMPATASTQQLTIDLLYPVTATVEWQRKSFNKMLKSVGLGKAALASSPARAPKYLVRDKRFLKDIAQMLADNTPRGRVDKAVRMHFAVLTAKILSPIKRYLYVSQRSAKNFSYAEFMYHLGQLEGGGGSSSGTGRGNRNGVETEDTDGGMAAAAGDMGKDLLNAMSLLTSLGKGAADEQQSGPKQEQERRRQRRRTPTPAVDTTAAPSTSIETGSGNGNGNSDAYGEDAVSEGLFAEAVAPERGLFEDTHSAVRFYGELLRSANFEAWCFL
ncbi:uncharacterized protein V1518DRAFT_126932 [Limtongia smithiae]|uniref:uncharacterized protein n=1 Tax=Limtongia smithiae TaxID=1125753 RepID=UPI0034CEFDDC